MRALSVQQPWPWLIFHGGKDLENRTWAPPADVVGTRIAIHVSKKAQKREPLEVMEHVYGMDIGEWWEPAIPVLADLPLGVLIGTVDVVEVSRDGLISLRGAKAKSRWWIGPYGWVLRNPKAFSEPVPAKGSLGLWRVPPELAERLEA